MSSLVCPQCMNGDHLWTVDRIDYDVWALKCGYCGWEGTSDDLLQKEPGL